MRNAGSITRPRVLYFLTEGVWAAGEMPSATPQNRLALGPRYARSQAPRRSFHSSADRELRNFARIPTNRSDNSFSNPRGTGR